MLIGILAAMLPIGLLQNKQRKLQYIDFNNMLYINIFDKLVSKASDEIIIQEVLPSDAKMFSASHDQHHTTEFLFEIYKR